MSILPKMVTARCGDVREDGDLRPIHTDVAIALLWAPPTLDKTVLQAGMTFAVDGGISVDGKLGGRIGDSVVVTETGFDYLTEYPRKVLLVDR